MTEVTSDDVARIAAKGLSWPDKLTPDEIKKVCGSALTQVQKEQTEDEFFDAYRKVIAKAQPGLLQMFDEERLKGFSAQDQLLFDTLRENFIVR